MSMIRELPLLLRQAGVNVREMDDWQELNGHPWENTEPEAHMHHHTASAAYTPNRDKANGWAGLSINGSERLYQEDYDGTGEAVYVFANLYPAPISAGKGDSEVLDAIIAGQLVSGRPGPDTPGWYGNNFYWSTEYVLDGVGAELDIKVWNMMVTVCRVQNELMGWSEVNHIMHATSTNRKVDLWDGTFEDFDDTLTNLRFAMTQEAGMNLERYATRWRKPEDFDAAVVRGIISEEEATYWKTVPTTSSEWQDLRDAVEVRRELWPA